MRNKDINPKHREELLAHLGVRVAGVKALPLYRLSLSDAQAASAIYAATLQAVEWIATEWQQMFKQKRKSPTMYPSWSVDYEPPSSDIETNLVSPDELVSLEADPFGTTYAVDGEPRVWIWRDVAAPEPLLSPKTVAALPGWWLFANHQELETGQAKPLEDVQLKQWAREGYGGEWQIGYPISIIGRSKEAILAEVRAALSIARGKLPPR